MRKKGAEYQFQWRVLNNLSQVPRKDVCVPLKTRVLHQTGCSVPTLTDGSPRKWTKEQVPQLQPFLGTQQHKYQTQTEGTQLCVNLNFPSSETVTTAVTRPTYRCFLMPLERASPPPQSFPSDILCFLLLPCSSSSSRDCAVTASS